MSQTIPQLKLNHMSFPTADIAATAGFFETYLGFTVAQKFDPKFWILKRPGYDVVIERAADDSPTPSTLAANRAPSTAFAACIGDDAKWPKAFHIGFELQTLEDVRALRDRLEADGHRAETDIFNPERGSRFFCRAPGGVMFEFTTRSDAAEQFRGTFEK